MIADHKEELVAKVKERIKKFNDVFDEMDPEDQDIKKEQAKNHLTVNLINVLNKKAKCPSCKTDALLTGKGISHSDPVMASDMVVVGFNVLPIGLRCFVCGLKLRGNGELSAADLGGQFTAKVNYDPIEYYGSGNRERDDDDEGNDDEYDEYDGMNEEPDFDYGND